MRLQLAMQIAIELVRMGITESLSAGIKLIINELNPAENLAQDLLYTCKRDLCSSPMQARPHDETRSGCDWSPNGLDC